MKETLVRVENIAPISHREGMALAETEYRRFSDMLEQLPRRVLGALRPLALQGRGHVLHSVVKLQVSSTIGEQI